MRISILEQTPNVVVEIIPSEYTREAPEQYRVAITRNYSYPIVYKYQKDAFNNWFWKKVDDAEFERQISAMCIKALVEHLKTFEKAK